MAELITHNHPPASRPILYEGQRLDQPAFHALYEQTPEKFHAELIGGVVHIMSPVSHDHAEPQSILVWWLKEFQFVSPGTAARGEVTVVLGPQSEPQPDACLRILESHGGRSWLQGRYLHGAPELMVEVALSSAHYDLHQKKADYEAAGVQEYLVILPEENTVNWFHLENGRYEPISADEEGIIKSLTFPGLWLDAAALLQDDGVRVGEILHRGIASAEHRQWVAEMAARRIAEST